MTAARALADTSLFIANETGRRINSERVPDAVAVSVVTIGELRAGVLAAATVQTRDLRLRTLSAAMALDPVPIDSAIAERWAALRVILRDRNLAMGVNDSWIAATAMALSVPLLTQDEGIPELESLQVIRV